MSETHERSLIVDAIEAVVRALQQASIPFVLLGGLAMQRWNRLRVTHDVDVAILTQASADDLAQALRPHRLYPDPERSPARLGDVTVLFFEFRRTPNDYPVRIDLLHSDADFHRSTIERAITDTFAGVSVPVSTAEDLILRKLIAPRPIDWADAVSLLREQADHLDEQYLDQWAHTLGVEDKLSKARAEAGETSTS